MKLEQHRYRVLDSWRGIFACFVALFHFRNVVNSHIYGLNFVEHAYVFVDFFFVLSGFVIFANYERKIREDYPLWKFMLLRFGRVYPLHLFLLLIVTAFCFAPLNAYIPAGTFAGELSYFPSQLFLLHGLGVDDRLSFNRPSWAVSSEFWSYALFGFLLVLFRRRIGYVLVLIIPAAAYILYDRDVHLNATFDYGFIRCAYSFAIGAVLWRIYTAQEARWAPSTLRRKTFWSLLELGIIVIVFGFVALAPKQMTLVLPFLFAATIAIFAFEAGIVSKLLTGKIFVLLGAVSYSIYMLQAFAVFGFTVFLPRLLPGHEAVIGSHDVWGSTRFEGDVVVIVYLFVVVVAAVFTYYLVEMPGRNFFRKIVRGAQGTIIE